MNNNRKYEENIFKNERKKNTKNKNKNKQKQKMRTKKKQHVLKKWHQPKLWFDNFVHLDHLVKVRRHHLTSFELVWPIYSLPLSPDGYWMYCWKYYVVYEPSNHSNWITNIFIIDCVDSSLYCSFFYFNDLILVLHSLMLTVMSSWVLYIFLSVLEAIQNTEIRCQKLALCLCLCKSENNAILHPVWNQLNESKYTPDYFNTFERLVFS